MASHGQDLHNESFFDDGFYNADESRINSLDRTIGPGINLSVAQIGAGRSRLTIALQSSQAVQAESGTRQQKPSHSQPSSVAALNGDQERQFESAVGDCIQNEFHTSSINISIPTSSSGAANIDLGSLTTTEIAEIDALYGISALLQLMEVGFSPEQSRIALNKCDGDVSRAISFCLEHGPEELQWLVSAESVLSEERTTATDDNNMRPKAKKGLFGKLFRGKSKQSSNTKMISSTQQRGAKAHARPPQTHLHTTAPMNPNFVDIPPSSSHHSQQKSAASAAAPAPSAAQIPSSSRPAVQFSPQGRQALQSSKLHGHDQQPYPHTYSSRPHASTAVQDNFNGITTEEATTFPSSVNIDAKALNVEQNRNVEQLNSANNQFYFPVELTAVAEETVLETVVTENMEDPWQLSSCLVEASAPAIFFDTDTNITTTSENDIITQQFTAAEKEDHKNISSFNQEKTYHPTNIVVDYEPTKLLASAPPLVSKELNLQSPATVTSNSSERNNQLSKTREEAIPSFDRKIQVTAVAVPGDSSSILHTHDNPSVMDMDNNWLQDNLGQSTTLRRRECLPYFLENLDNGKVRAIISLKQLELQKTERSPQGQRPDEVFLDDCPDETIAQYLCECYAPPLWESRLQAGNSTCMLCQMFFTKSSQPRHCRNCGYLICGNCSDKLWPGSMLPETFHDDEKYVRVCHCCHVLVELFVVALCAGDYQTVRALYATGNVNLHQPYSVYTHQAYPVHYAAIGGNLDILRWLIDVKRCIIVNQAQKTPLTTQTGWTLLSLAAHCGHVDMVRFLVHEKKCQLAEITEPITLQRVLHALLEVPGALPKFSMQKDDLMLMLLHNPRLRLHFALSAANNKRNTTNNESGIDVGNKYDSFSASISPSINNASALNSTHINRSAYNSEYFKIPVATATEAPVIVSHTEAAPVTINSFNLPSQVNLSATHWTLAQLTKPLPKHRWLCAQAIFRVQEYLEMQRRSMFYTLPPAISHPPAAGEVEGSSVSVLHDIGNSSSGGDAVGDVVALASLVDTVDTTNW